MTKLKKVLLSAAVGAAMAGGSFAANAAAPIDLGAVQYNIATPFSGTILGAGGFIQDFTFTLPVNGGSGYSVVNLPLNFGPGLTANILLTSLSLFSDTDATPWNNSGEALVFSKNSVPSNTDSVSFAVGASAGGNYILQVAGTANGALGGVFNGSINVSPVPEPETWAMMLIGAGLVGFQLRRRAKQSATQRLV